MKINLGSGYKRIDGFLNVDADKNCNPDYLVNLETDVLPFEDSTVDYVIAQHILEHIGPGFFHLLQELYRVCSDGAIIDITVPHYLHVIYAADPTHKRPITTEGMRLFSKKHNLNEIDRQGSSSTLALMYNVDFEIVDSSYVIDPFYYEMLDSMSDSERVRLGREACNVVLEEKIKLQVIKG